MPRSDKSSFTSRTADVRRKGSWAVRFYGAQRKLPALKDKRQPTRFALTAAAWGEPVDSDGNPPYRQRPQVSSPL